MHVQVDQSRCVAAGQCVVAAPDVFDQRDEDGIVTVLQSAPDPAHDDAVLEAAAPSPSAAIALAGCR